MQSFQVGWARLELPETAIKMADSPSTPPRVPPGVESGRRVPKTPEQVRRMEENRLRAKALREQQSQSVNRQGSATVVPPPNYPPSIAGQKRPRASAPSLPPTARDARNPVRPDAKNSHDSNGLAQAQDPGIRGAKKFQKYVEYDFSKMTDTKGGFMTQEDDPYNKALYAPGENGKPAGMTLKEWERQQLQKRLRNQRSGPYEPGLSVLDEQTKKRCRECESLEIDWQWEELLHVGVCYTCKEKYPEKYSLLTKTEAKEDYLLTDPELKDEELLPHLEKPNPHKSSWNSMMLYLRFQVEEYAFSDKKWGSPEALDEEFVRRQKETKERKEKKFKNKLNELKKRTRVDAYKRARGGGGGEFGDTIGKRKHEHEWGGVVEDAETGAARRTCVECGMEVEELEF